MQTRYYLQQLSNFLALDVVFDQTWPMRLNRGDRTVSGMTQDNPPSGILSPLSPSSLPETLVTLV